MALQDDDRPMAERRELSVKERQRLLRERAGSLPVAKQQRSTLRPTARRALVTVVARGGLHAKKDEVDKKVLEELESLEMVHRVTSRKGLDMWRATETGRGWVAATGLLPVFLHRRSELGTTHSAAQGLVSAGEDMRPQSDRPNLAA